MERVLSELIAGLLDAGDDVTVISRTCAVPAHPHLRWVRVPGPARPLPVAYPWFLVLGSLITRWQRRGMVLSTGAIIANRVDWSAVHLCHHAVRDLGISRISRRTPAYRMNARLARWISLIGERYCYRPKRVSGLIGVSRGVSAELERYFQHMPVVTIPNGVGVDRFKPNAAQRRKTRQRYGVREGELLAVFVGSEWERKGLMLAIDALRHATRWKLLVAGSGDVERYQAVAAESGVSHRVVFAGVVDDPAPVYCASDAFVLPSVYETFSLVSYEAAASGVPVLGTPVSGVTDLIVDGHNGWFIERNAADIGGKLAALSENPELRAQMGAAGRRAAAEFTWSRMVAGYRRLLENGRADAVASTASERGQSRAKGHEARRPVPGAAEAGHGSRG